MFSNEIAINETQIGQFQRIVSDLPPESWFQPGAGHGHSPAWIVGHLALIGQMGQKMLGGELSHPHWMPIFGLGSSGSVESDPQYEKQELVSALETAYLTLRQQAATAPVEHCQKPHGVSVFDGTPVQTIGQLTALILTNHFGFHLAQLSSCRREAGHPALF